MPSEEIKKKLAKYDPKPKSEREDPTEIPGWVKVAIALRVFENKTLDEAAARFGRAGSTLQGWMAAPACKKWRDDLVAMANDPQEVGRAIIGGSVGRAAATLIWALEEAERAGDYVEARKIANDVLGTFNVAKTENAQANRPTIIINVPVGQGISSPEPEFFEVESESLKEVEDADVRMGVPLLPAPRDDGAEDQRSG